MTLHRSTPTAQAWRRLRTGGFRQVELNLAGWTAVFGPGAIAGAVGGIVFDRPLIFAVAAGIIGGWLVAVLVDRWRWSGDLAPSLGAELGRAA